MCHASAAGRLAMATTCLAGTVSVAATLDFGSVPVGTVYGADAGTVPGEAVLTQEGIAMSFDYFQLGTFTDFHLAEVGGRHADSFSTEALSLNNINAVFDFAEVGFDVGLVTFEFRDFGGSSNFAVNGAAMYIIDPLADLPSDVAPGITASVDGDLVTITGETTEIFDVLVGGQELVIDNITALPDPSAGLLLAFGTALLYRRSRRRPH